MFSGGSDDFIFYQHNVLETNHFRTNFFDMLVSGLNWEFHERPEKFASIMIEFVLGRCHYKPIEFEFSENVEPI